MKEIHIERRCFGKVLVQQSVVSATKSSDRSGLAEFHTEKALKSGGLPEGLHPWCMCVRCSAAGTRAGLASVASGHESLAMN